MAINELINEADAQVDWFDRKSGMSAEDAINAIAGFLKPRGGMLYSKVYKDKNVVANFEVGESRIFVDQVLEPYGKYYNNRFKHQRIEDITSDTAIVVVGPDRQLMSDIKKLLGAHRDSHYIFQPSE